MTIHCDTAPNGTAQVGIPSCQWQMLTVPPAKPYRYALHLPGTVKTLLEKSGCPLQMVAAVPSPLRAAAERRKPRGSARRAAHREPAGPPDSTGHCRGAPAPPPGGFCGSARSVRPTGLNLEAGRLPGLGVCRGAERSLAATAPPAWVLPGRRRGLPSPHVRFPAGAACVQSASPVGRSILSRVCAGAEQMSQWDISPVTQKQADARCYAFFISQQCF